MAILDSEKDGDMLDASLAASFYAKYNPKKLLGTGASSTVRSCIAKDTDEEFAVKILDLNSGVDTPEMIRDECMREVSILRRVSGHRHIIDLHDVFQGDAYIFLVFEVCRVGELFDYLTRMVSLSEKRTRALMRQILEAVTFVHTRGIVHRDLKPENILLDDNLNIKVTDFGLAVFETDHEELLEIRGTPGYLAPEVLKAGYYDNQPPYGQPVDVWACGVIMYTLLVGFPPFWHRKEHLMLRQIMEGRYSFPSPEWDEISEPAKDLIRKMLVVDSSERIKAKEALSHEFFTQGLSDVVHTFDARRKFRSALIAMRFIHLLKSQKTKGRLLSITQLTTDPYSDRRLRKIIDSLAYDVYRQWIKKGDDQNRAALFQNSPSRKTASNDEGLSRDNTLEYGGDAYDASDNSADEYDLGTPMAY